MREGRGRRQSKHETENGGPQIGSLNQVCDLTELTGSVRVKGQSDHFSSFSRPLGEFAVWMSPVTDLGPSSLTLGPLRLGHWGCEAAVTKRSGWFTPRPTDRNNHYFPLSAER